jgi:hypothetical protein
MQPARFLKILVIALGLAIVVALGFVIYGFVRLSADMDRAATPADSAGQMPFVTDLGQPAGSEIIATAALGAGRLTVSVRGGGLPERIVIVDARTGRSLGVTYVSPP